jgi:hypothetical protein
MVLYSEEEKRTKMKEMIDRGDKEMLHVISGMRVHLKRWPTEDEVYRFIMGDINERAEILGLNRNVFDMFTGQPAAGPSIAQSDLSSAMIDGYEPPEIES